MSTLPKILLFKTSLYSGTKNTQGQLCNIYTPLLNLADKNTKVLGDFTTTDLNFDMEHPVDIILQDSYDGAVNMVINDGKNKPRLINSRFSVQDEGTFKIPDHSGFKDTNIYDEETFDVDTLLKAIPIKIPVVTYNGLVDNGGKLHCGTYVFYFKLADADGNETEVIAESGIVLCHIGSVNQPNSIRMGQLDENSCKAIKFTLSGIDAGFDFIHVLFSRTSSADDLAAATTYNKIIFDFPVNKDGVCEITITGAETILGISKNECSVDYADINSVKTQTVNNNVLLFGNVDTPEHDWDAIKRFTWKIVPRWALTAEGAIGSLDTNYKETSITKNKIDECGYCYYNTKNVYYRLGYWPDEIYRFGIVYIFSDNSLSPVINLQGVDFTTTSDLTDNVTSINRPDTTEYEQIFFTEENLKESRLPEYLYEEDLLYFNKKYRTNSRGVIKFPPVNVKNVIGGVLLPRPLYINFDLSLIGYKYALDNSNHGDYTSWDEVLKKHNIKGFFFVRLKRVPTILGQGMVVGLSHKLCGALPVIKNGEGLVVVQPFLSQERLLEEEAKDFTIQSGYKIFTGDPSAKEPLFRNQAMLYPDAEIDEASYNQLFVSNEFSLFKEGINIFSYNSSDHTANIDNFSYKQEDFSYKTKLLNIPEDTKTLTNGVDYFSTLAGIPDEPYKTVDIMLAWKWTPPLNLTVSTSLLRGKWGPFVGMSNPNEENPISLLCPFNYGEVYNVRTATYEDPDTATDLDFQKIMNSNSSFFAISPRTEMVQNIDCFRGDCFISMFTHRMFRNFTDPELPTNTQIVDPTCWQKNYGVRCTAVVETNAHSNLTGDSNGWYIKEGVDNSPKWTQAIIYLLTGNIIGFIILAALTTKEPDYKELGIETDELGNPLPYKYGYANEIVLAFEVYTGGAAFNPLFPLTSLIKKFKAGYRVGQWDEPNKKKLNPKELEKSGGFNLKAVFKADDDWELRGLSGINRADVNAVAMGQWITFPILSNKNLALRDIDFSNATEEASFNRKRSFYPLMAKDVHNPLRDSNVINQASAVTLPDKPYYLIPKVPYFKLEYFTRINNSLRDSSSSVTNEFKIMLLTAYHDYTKVYGSITKLISFGNYVFVIFKHGIGVLDMAKSIASALDVNSYLPEVSIISDTYGSMWKDSIIQTPNCIYGVDSVAKVIWAILGTSVKIISDMKVGKFLVDNIDMSEFNFRPYIGHINIKSHYNAFKHDVMFTYYNDLIYVLPASYPSSNGYYIDLDGFICKDGERILQNDSTVKAERLVPKYDNLKQKWQTYSEMLEGKDYQWVKGTNWSLCWNEDLQLFLTFYDWIPIESENIDNIYFSFDKDGIDEINNKTNGVILNPKFCSSITYEEYKDFNIGAKYKKNLIDSAFTNDTLVYNVKKIYDSLLRYPGNQTLFILLANNSYDYHIIRDKKPVVFSCYLKLPSTTNKVLFDFYQLRTLPEVQLTSSSFKLIIISLDEIKNDTWVFVTIFLSKNSEVPINFVKITSDGDYMICEPKFCYTEITLSLVDKDIEIPDVISEYKNFFAKYYEYRSTDNSMKLWKHGQSGIYDNQGKIKPTNWYGKQHEFNFEFIVNENAALLKIFNNLKIISNKAEPYKFEYEVVGEAYDWFEYKEIVHWINNKVKTGVFKDLDTAYKYVLSNNIETIKQSYTDFPDLFNKDYSYYIIPKLPYLEIKLSDKKGLPDKDKSYTTHTTKIDNWSSEDKSLGINDYKLNNVETIIVEDELLNEYRVHTELYGNNMKKFGRVRGNMEYLEDLWDIEVRPITFRWVYLDLEGNLVKTNSVEARLRDKYIKIKVRYTGEDLVIIQAISTMFDYSFA